MNKGELRRRAWEIIEPHLIEQGFDLVEIEYAMESGRWILRVYIDKESGITLDDCTRASQVLSPALDAAEFTDGSYYLEVSSPGIDRPVRKAEDFTRFIGERIKLRAVTPLVGRRNFNGTLVGFRDGMVVVECDGNTYEIHAENVEKAKLDR